MKLKVIDNDDFRQLNKEGCVRNKYGLKETRRSQTPGVNNETSKGSYKCLSLNTDKMGFMNFRNKLRFLQTNA